VVWVTEEPHTPSVAGEDQGGVAARRAGEQRPQVVVGRVGIPHLELDRGPDLDPLADRQGAGLAVGAEDAAHEEVALPELEPVLVDRDADLEPGRDPGALVGVGGRDHLVEAVERGPAGQLHQQVALGSGDDHRVADRPAALRHDHRGGDLGRQHHADAAGVAHLVVEDQPVVARVGRGRRHPAHHRHRRVEVAQRLDDGVDGQRERVGQEQQAVARGERVAGQAAQGQPRPGADGGQPDRPGRRRQPGGPQRHRGIVLDLPAAAEHRDRGGPEQHPGADQRPHRGRDVGDRADVVGRAEQDGQVGRPGERLEDGPDHLAGGLGGVGVEGEGLGEGHGGGLRSVRGRSCTARS
jgi:hypothetical protein